MPAESVRFFPSLARFLWPLPFLQVTVIWAILFSAVPLCAQSKPNFVEGQKVEVREGDEWSAARILKKEGRKFLVHYDGSDAASDEWLTVERLRAAGGQGGPTPQPASRPAARPFLPGEAIEFKSGPFWQKGVVINIRGKWYFIQHDHSRDRE